MNWEDLTSARSRETYTTGEPMLDVYWKTFLGGHTVRTGDGWADERQRMEFLIQETRIPFLVHLDRCLLIYGAARAAQVAGLAG